ncbi:MAG: hypothetical protein ACRDFQ_00060 [Anaerolineales bacterium]
MKLKLVAAVLVLAVGCSGGTNPSAIATSVAQTLAAQAAQATEPPTSVPAATDTAALLANETAPDPLPAANTSIALNAGECFDFDTGAISTPDGDCDMWAVEGALVRQMNGAKMSGYVTSAPPSNSYCILAAYDPNDIAIQTDLYMCFISNQGTPGFVVARSYIGSVPFTGFIFDYWLYN